MQLSKAIKIRIDNLLEERSLTRHSLSLLAGISPSVLTDLYRGKVSYLRIDSLLHICEGLGIELRDFFDDDVFNDVNAEK